MERPYGGPCCEPRRFAVCVLNCCALRACCVASGVSAAVRLARAMFSVPGCAVGAVMPIAYNWFPPVVAVHSSVLRSAGLSLVLYPLCCVLHLV